MKQAQTRGFPIGEPPCDLLPKSSVPWSSMTEQSLRTLVAGLRAELAQAHDLDADAREALHSLAGEVEALLQRPAAGSRPAELPLRERLADRVRELEASHPDLSRTVANLIDTLAFYNL